MSVRSIITIPKKLDLYGSFLTTGKNPGSQEYFEQPLLGFLKNPNTTAILVKILFALQPTTAL